MNKKQIRRFIFFFAAYNSFLSVGMISMCAPIWNQLDPTIRTLVIALAVTVILEVPIWIYEIWKMTKRKRATKGFCKSFAEAIDCSKMVHEQRYIAYLSGDTKSVEKCTESIKENATQIIQCAKTMQELDIFNKNQKQQIQEGIEDLQYLLNNVVPKNRTL